MRRAKGVVIAVVMKRTYRLSQVFGYEHDDGRDADGNVDLGRNTGYSWLGHARPQMCEFVSYTHARAVSSRTP